MAAASLKYFIRIATVSELDSDRMWDLSVPK
jgi:hypothetical protein